MKKTQILVKVAKAREKILGRAERLTEKDLAKLRALRGLKRVVYAGGPQAFFELKDRAEKRQKHKTI